MQQGINSFFLINTWEIVQYKTSRMRTITTYIFTIMRCMLELFETHCVHPATTLAENEKNIRVFFNFHTFILILLNHIIQVLVELPRYAYLLTCQVQSYCADFFPFIFLLSRYYIRLQNTNKWILLVELESFWFVFSKIWFVLRKQELELFIDFVLGSNQKFIFNNRIKINYEAFPIFRAKLCDWSPI